ncbi:MAG TPA: LptF/LptG family permease, partial [Nitrospinota bacterium]|nr:LptF/LptG family permease [Nitrospinota bacterium]
LPNGNQAFRELLFRILRTQANYEIKSKLFNNDFKNMIIYVDEKDENSPLMKGIFISETTKEGENRIINAEKGTLLSDKNAFVVQMKLTNGTIHRLGKDKKNYHTLKFKRYILEMEIPKPEEIGGNLLRGNRELSISKLKEKIEKHKKEGITISNELVELHKKFSIPFAALIFGLIGAPLGVKCSRSGKSGSFTMSLFVIVFYYILLLFGESLGDTGKLHPFLAMWLPNFVVIIIAVYLVYKTANELPFKYWQYTLDKLMESYHYVKRFLISDIGLKKIAFLLFVCY